MKKKGLSFEEKRNRLLAIFHENVNPEVERSL